jgi:hypothetical protein
MTKVAALVLGLTLLAPLAACAADRGRVDTPPPESDERYGDQDHDRAIPVARYDRPFRLAYGKTVRVEHTNTRARFAELIEDSRCPRDVQCIQAGRARVRLSVRRGNAAPVSIELSTDKDGATRNAGGVTWELQAVEPYPAAGVARRPQEYTLTLVARPLR